MRKAQEGYKRQYDKKKRGNPAFKVGDKVWLSSANLKLPCPSRKLGPKFIGPFEIKREINPVAFELALPESYKIHPVFHVALLKHVISSPFPGREEIPPPPVLVGDETEFEVESILDCRRRGRTIQFLIKWKGYPAEESSWEPASHVHAPRLIQRFRNSHPAKWAQMGIRRLPVGRGHCQGNRRIPVRNGAGLANLHRQKHCQGTNSRRRALGPSISGRRRTLGPSISGRRGTLGPSISTSRSHGPI